MKSIFCTIILLFIVSTYSISAAGASQQPQWVANPESVYPNQQWVYAVETANTEKNAKAASIAALTRYFRQSFQSSMSATRNLDQSITRSDDPKTKNTNLYREDSSITENVTSTSNIKTLIGVKTLFWHNKKTETFYAIALMNRSECIKQYQTVITENERTIDTYKKRAASNKDKLQTYIMLNAAYDIAQTTDELIIIRNILDASADNKMGAYGGSEAIKLLLHDAALNIVVDINGSNDFDKRISSALSKCFTRYGFIINDGKKKDGTHILSADVKIENIAQSNDSNYAFVRYALNVSLRDSSGGDILVFSNNGREGHKSIAEARQRCIRTIEQIIADEFSVKFDEHLAAKH